MAKDKTDSVSKSGSKGGSGYSEPSYFDQVTGTNDFERQSWRDNFNGGVAAGDWTGATNARLSSERADNYGATESGSSTQYSAAEVRDRINALPERIQAEIRGGAASVPQQSVVGAMNAQKGSPVPSAAVVGLFGGAFGNALAYKPMDLAIGGADVQANPYYSNAEDVETRHGDVGAALYAPISIGADLGHNAARMYFGDNYQSLSTETRLGILGSHAQQIVKSSAESAGKSALESFFGGMSAVEDWGRRNKAAEEAGARAAAEVDAAWDLREKLQAEEANMARWSGQVVAAPVHW